MEVRQVIDSTNQRDVNVGSWDWEQDVAHRANKRELSQTELMQYLRDERRVEMAQRVADEDARLHARKLAVVVDGFLPEAECDALVARVEGEGLLSSTKSETLQHCLANCNFEQSEGSEARLAFARDVSARLWARLLELDGVGDHGRALLAELRTAPEWSARDYHVRHAAEGRTVEMRLAAMSDYIRFMRYSARKTIDAAVASTHGDFATDPRNAHHDGRNKRAAGDSFMTALLYLSSEDDSMLRGGGTLFLDAAGEPLARVSPRKGSLLLFDHHLYHRGEAVVAGVKNVLRSDLLYRPVDVCNGETLEC
uniref:Prolyl 4-hydroxylase alpha subunit domain-containing protein n=1 Tax=Calcidiscus leptoporus TaxID=127549 RepID=A0A7S0NY33_9EUKA|mmetsp:Transcript_34487/g.80796  ORF Transcript_34487/g.80796 Transcript_34487/m.80796 type:complete len:310 (+) Transcript_34487:44-973(+)